MSDKRKQQQVRFDKAGRPIVVRSTERAVAAPRETRA